MFFVHTQITNVDGKRKSETKSNALLFINNFSYTKYKKKKIFFLLLFGKRFSLSFKCFPPSFLFCESHKYTITLRLTVAGSVALGTYNISFFNFSTVRTPRIINNEQKKKKMKNDEIRNVRWNFFFRLFISM